MIQKIFCALAFLTRIPMPKWVHEDVTHLQKSASWFPLIGLILGGCYAGTAWLLRPILPVTVVAVILLVEDTLLTGALHLDGLADMADGLGGGRTRADVLRIMRDHAVGAYGATALICCFLLKAACLSDLLAKSSGLGFLLAIPALARWGIVLLSCSEPYARASGEGSGALVQSISRVHLAIATCVSAGLPFFLGWRRTLACWLAVAVVTWLVARMARRRIGGITGDVVGANVVICESIQLVVALAVSLL